MKRLLYNTGSSEVKLPDIIVIGKEKSLFSFCGEGTDMVVVVGTGTLFALLLRRHNVLMQNTSFTPHSIITTRASQSTLWQMGTMDVKAMT